MIDHGILFTPDLTRAIVEGKRAEATS